jgi:hypothetical protein
MCAQDVPIGVFLAWTEPGDQDWSWRSQFKWLVKNHAEQLASLRQDIAWRGQLVPVIVGSDGRLWDGHHRVYAIVELGWPNITVYSRCENCEEEWK